MEAAWNHVKTQEDFLHSENNMRASRILASSMKKISVGFAKARLATAPRGYRGHVWL